MITHTGGWRIKYTSRPLVEPKTIAGAEIADVVPLLAEPEDRTRYRVRRELAQRPATEVIPAVKRWLSGLDADDPAAIEALWVHQSHNEVDAELLEQLLQSPDFRVRAAATRVIGYWRDQLDEPLEMLRRQANDEHPRVRLEAVRACSFFRSAEAAEVALEILNHPVDVYLQYVLDETMLQLDQF